jgi:uroporphyrin-III C-methyltransferase
LKKGKVYLVGAGPGDPGLVTLRAVELLRKADVVIYDRLVGDGVLDFVAESAKRIYAGRVAASGGFQERTNSLMVSEAKKGKMVVRLKGGDPFVFGRGGEEAEVLERNHIAFEVVPGVTSAIGGPAYSGIPVTHRSLASSVMIVTGHEMPDKKEGRVDWRLAARAADTIVVLMGAATFSSIARELIKGGLSKQTPVAVIERATTSKQRTRLFLLGSLASEDVAETIKAPSVVVVGRVASLAKKLDWFKVAGRTTLLEVEPSEAKKNEHITRES